jgi:ribonuclease HI
MPETHSISQSSSPSLVKAVYTDGACSGNPGPGGWGVVVQLTDGQEQELGGSAAQTTNNRMELQAAIEAVKFLETIPQLAAGACVHTDSEYVKNGITKWLSNWKKRGWKTAQGKPVLNQDLWEALDALNPNRFGWQYIKAHAGHPGNERADAIARAFSLKQKPNLANLAEETVDHQSLSLSFLSSDPSSSDLSEHVASSHASPESGCADESRQQPPFQQLLMSLQQADLIACRGYLITSAELAELFDQELSTIVQRGDEWSWRNWKVSRVREEEGQILWQLERVYGQPS